MSERAGLLIVDTCWRCGCMDDAPCVDLLTGEACAWTDGRRNFCTGCALDYGGLMMTPPQPDSEVLVGATAGEQLGGAW
ncbi:MAG: hypothetical protein ABMA13_18255 [Chthoniobacteraceae bacterium]